MSSITGGEFIASMLEAEGVEVVFGIIDGTYFGLYANLAKHGIHLITPRHESSAVHMAGAYARMSGRLGVCIASNGPGVANALPGVAVEDGEGNRVLLITSSRRTGIAYPDRGGTFQYFNQVAVTKPMTKWAGTIPSFERIPELMHRALRISWSRRPGVVHVDVPEDVMNGKFKPTGSLLDPARYRRIEPLVPTADDVQRTVELARGTTRFLIHAGSGVAHAGAHDELARVAELLAAPVTTSWGGRGAIAETSLCAVPMPYVGLNDKVRNEADVVLSLGSRIGETDWWGKAPYWRRPAEQKLIQVDIDEEMFGLNKPVDLPILADLKLFLNQLGEALAETELPDREKRRGWLQRIAANKIEARTKLDEKLSGPDEPVNPPLVPKTCRDVFPDDTVFVVDGGNTAIWANFFVECRVAHTMLSTFKFGMLGAGIGQALGAKVSRPDKPVCCIIGDGAMGFHPQELETAVRNGLAVIYVVMCDKQWGMVKMNQQFALKPLKTMIRKSLDASETINADLGAIRFDLVAQAMGAHGEYVTRGTELAAALERAIASQLPAVVHVDVDPVAHMWAPNLKTFKDMHQEPKG
jgi:acetolactate synthase-1/2/3 large subunit